MATFMAIDETSGLLRDDTSTALPSALDTNLTSLLGAGYNSTIVEKAVKATGFNFGANVTDLALTGTGGATLNGYQSGLLALNGTEILLYSSGTSGNSGTNNNLVIGRVGGANGAIALVFYLEPTGGTGDSNATSAKLWTIEFQPLKHPDGTNSDDFVSLANALNIQVTNPISFDATGAPSGSNLFITYGDGTYTPNEVAVIVTAPDAADQSSGANISSGGVVKTSQAGSNLGGATFGKDSQMFDPPDGKPAESLYFTFVTGATPGLVVNPAHELSPTEANIENNIQFTSFFGAERVSFVVSQLQQAKMATLQVSAWNAQLNTHGTVDTSDDTPWTQTDYVNHQNQNDAVAVEAVTITRVVSNKGSTTTYEWTFTEDQSTHAVTITTKKNGSASSAQGDQPGAFNVSADFSGATAVLKGMIAGDKILYDTVGTHDRLQITNVGDADAQFDAAFDIGAIKLESGGITNFAVGAIDFYDDGPTKPTVSGNETAVLDESRPLDSDTAGGTSPNGVDSVTASFADNFSTPAYGKDGAGSTAYSLVLNGSDVASGLYALDPADFETANDPLGKGAQILLNQSGNKITGAVGGTTYFTIEINTTTGVVTFTQSNNIWHPTTGSSYDEAAGLSTAAAADIKVVQTVTDADSDSESASINVGQGVFSIQDDGPTLTQASSAPDAANAAELGNQAGQSVTGDFGYNIGTDSHTYAQGASDFVDANSGLGGVQLTLTGTVNGPPATAITQAVVTLTSEDATQATFDWSFHYDKDPLTAGVQDGTASGTLSFDKVNDTFTVTDTTPVQGFSFDVIHTSELLSKEPTSNVGHPNIVVEKLASDDPSTPENEAFFVQFTGNNGPFSFTSNGQGSSADTSFAVDGHDMFASDAETWVSATQSTNGVAGDTIQKGEGLTLRFFDSSPGIANEATSPSTTADGVAVKFDGIGNSEDLMVVLDLIDFGQDGVRGGGDDTTITRAIRVDNADIYKKGQVPSPYSSEFTLDNNDGLIIIESNDYNATGEHYHIQGLQILQSANGMTGDAIDLQRAVGGTGGSNTTLNLQPFDVTDNDVLKITDIGFLQSTSRSQTASLDFAFNIVDGDGDLLGVQHIDVLISNAFIV